jgi:3-phenylpropionate/cinnamic acid dioxygenase small subunit
MSGDEDLSWLLDRTRIVDVISRYATGLDARDWELWRSVFPEETVFDLSSWNDVPGRLLNTDRVVAAQARLFAELSVTQHFITNHRVEITGDSARVLAHMRAEHWIDTTDEAQCARYTMFGYYDDDLIRTPDGWKISRMQLRVTRTQGDRWVMEEAQRRMQAKRPKRSS